jgi:hypothetical protein
MTVKHAYKWVPFTKAEELPDGTMLVAGPATDATIDRDGQRMSQEWLDRAMPKWEAEGGNVRESHDVKRAIGTSVGMNRADDGSFLLTAHIVDDQAIKKVKAKVLKGFSIGAVNPEFDFGDPAAPMGTVVGGDIIEVSLVDRPSNPNSYFVMAKSEGAGLLLVEQWQTSGAEEPDLEKKVSAAQRKEYAKTGVAMKNGDFPIPDEGHLRAAIGRLANYTGNKAAARRHIIKRAKALGKTSMLPKDWHVSKAQEIHSEVAGLVIGAVPPELTKATAAEDIMSAKGAIAAIARIIQSEADSLADGMLAEDYDICCLLDAVSALKRFIFVEGREDTPDDESTEMLYRSQEDELTAPAEQPPADAPVEPSEDAPEVTEAPETPAEETEAPAEVPAETAPGVPEDLDAKIAAAVAKASGAQQEQIELLKSQLAQALSQPAPGGPVMMRTSQQINLAKTKDRDNLLAQAAELQLAAQDNQSHDPVLAQGYRERAALILSKAQAIQ